MSISYSIYTFPATKFNELVRKRASYVEMANLLVRGKIKDKKIIGFLADRIEISMKGEFLDLSNLYWTVKSFVWNIEGYETNIKNYKAWIESDERKFLAKNRNKRPYTQPSAELLKAVQEAVGERVRRDNKLYFPMELIDEKGREIKFYELSYKKGGEIGMKLFWNEGNYNLFDKIGKLKTKEKEWKRLRKWFDNRNDWLKKRGIDRSNFGTISKLNKFNYALDGTVLNHCHLASYEFDDQVTTVGLREYSDKLTTEISELEESRYKYPVNSKEDLEMLKKKEDLLKQRFSITPFNLKERMDATVLVFDLAKLKKAPFDAIFQPLGLNRDKMVGIMKTAIKYNEDVMFWDAG